LDKLCSNILIIQLFALSRGLAKPRASGGAKGWELYFEPEPRLRCEDVVQTTLASVEAPHRSEGYDRAEMLRGRGLSNRERLFAINNIARKGSGKTFIPEGR
jgi:hypothetical protein